MTETQTQTVPPLPWDDALDRWTKFLRANKVGEETIKTRRVWVARLAESAGVPHVEDLTSDHVAAHLAALECKPGTRNKVLACLRQFCGWAAANGRLASDPTAGLRRERNPQTATGSRALTPELVAKLVRAARADKRVQRRGEKYAEAYAVAGALGLRISEIEQMTTAWVDWAARLVTIPMEVSKSNRDDPIPVPPWALEILRRLHDELPAADKPTRLFGIKRFDHRTFYRHCAAAGIDPADGRRPLTPHGLRKTCGTTYEAIGTPHGLVQRIMRHVPTDLTGAVYVDADLMDWGVWAARFPDFWSGEGCGTTSESRDFPPATEESGDLSLPGSRNEGILNGSNPNARRPHWRGDRAAEDRGSEAKAGDRNRTGDIQLGNVTTCPHYKDYVRALQAELTAANRLRKALEAGLFGAVLDDGDQPS